MPDYKQINQVHERNWKQPINKYIIKVAISIGFSKTLTEIGCKRQWSGMQEASYNTNNDMIIQPIITRVAYLDSLKTSNPTSTAANVYN